MRYDQLCEGFDKLTPAQKAKFIDARLEWASGGAVCCEVHMRICKPIIED